MHAHRSQREQPVELIGIGRRERGGRNLPHPVAIPRLPGMRQAMAVGPHRADEQRDGALRGCRRRAVAAHINGVAIAVAVLRPVVPEIDEGDLAVERAGGQGLDLIEVVEPHDSGLEPTFGGRHGAAERGDGERLRMIADNGGALDAAAPAGQREGLDMDIGETERAHRPHRPCARPRLGVAAGEPRPDLGGERLDEVVAAFVGKPGLAERARGGKERRWQVRHRRLGQFLCPCRRRAQQERRRDKHSFHDMISRCRFLLGRELSPRSGLRQASRDCVRRRERLRSARSRQERGSPSPWSSTSFTCAD